MVTHEHERKQAIQNALDLARLRVKSARKQLEEAKAELDHAKRVEANLQQQLIDDARQVIDTLAAEVSGAIDAGITSAVAKLETVDDEDS